MNNVFRLSNNFLDKLNDKEIYLLINILPKEILLESIKKHPKKFKNETKGYKIDVKSKRLMNKLLNVYFNGIKKHDIDIINIMKKNVNFIINEVNKHISEVTSDDYFLEKIIASNDINNFVKLIDIILDKLKPEYVKLFFKLIDQELSDEQNNYIDTQMPIIIMKRELEKEISGELKKEYKSRIINMQNQFKIEISNQVKKTKEIKKKLNNIKIKFNDEKEYSNSLCDKIEKNKIEKNNEINVLQKDIKKLNYTINKIIKEKDLLESSIKDKNLTIERLNKDLSIKYDKYSIIAQEKWDLENEKLLNIRNSLDKKCKDLEKIKMVLNDSIRTLEIEKAQLESKISKYKNIVSKFIDNIDEKLIEKALYDSLLKNDSNNFIQAQNVDNKVSDLYIKNNEIETNIKECDNIEDFAENIAINLENIGVKNIADEVANYIIGILASGMIPLICGYKARDIATAISNSYSGETPYIITLPNGYTNSKELLKLYNLAKSNVVLIEDAVGTMNENALMPLLREKLQTKFSTKLLLLSTENLDSVKYMPSNLFNQVALVMINKYSINKKTDYKISDARKVLEQFTSLNSFENEYKIIKKLLFNLNLNSPYDILRAIIIAYSHKLSNSKLAFQGYVRSELMFICNCNSMLSDLEKNIQKYQLSDTLLKIVKSGLDE